MKLVVAFTVLAFFSLVWWRISRDRTVKPEIAILGALITTVAAPFLFVIATAVVTIKFIELMWREITT